MSFLFQKRLVIVVFLIVACSFHPAHAKRVVRKAKPPKQTSRSQPVKPKPKPKPPVKPVAASRLRDIPALKRQPMSDWVNVKTLPQPAVGDGKADDTAAIQAAIDKVGRLGKERDFRALITVYIPAGTYRITRTLKISDAAREYQAMIGVTIVGDGALTRLVWDGPTDPQVAMVMTDGMGYGRIDGLVLDGAGKAGVGIDHAAVRTFETEFDHYSLSLRNLSTAGIRIGHTTRTASAEMIYKNCVFDSCGTGISIETFNDYDNVITGCEFRKSGRAIVLGYGTNAYIRNSHFEYSNIADIIAYGPLHPCSVRRCTSVGSKRFVEWASSVATIAIQDCQVESWTATDGAVLFADTTVPAILFDCTFKNPPSDAPPITSRAQPLLYSNVTAPGSKQAVADPAEPRFAAIEVPPGKLGANLTSAQQTFLEPIVIPGKVFDARSMGAVADGVADDTAAIQATIDAARKYGKGAMAYFPPGRYNVTRTIEMTGSDYIVRGGGSGFYTEWLWGSADANPILHIKDVDRVRLECLNIGSSGSQKNSRDILQEATRPGTMTYESVWVWGNYMKAPDTRGLQIKGLPKGSVVHLRHIGGNATYTDCSRAQILIDATWEGAIVVEGANEQVRDGIFACLSRFNSSEPYGLYVKDNQNAIITDYYTESADAYLSLSGGEGQKPGRVTLAGVKLHTAVSPAINIENYEGQISIFGLQFWAENYKIAHQGDRKLDLVLAGNMSTGGNATPLVISLGEGATLTAIGNYWGSEPPNTVSEEGLKRLAIAMDDFRRLGALDLSVNHPDLFPGPVPDQPA